MNGKTVDETWRKLVHLHGTEYFGGLLPEEARWVVGRWAELEHQRPDYLNREGFGCSRDMELQRKKGELMNRDTWYTITERWGDR